MRMKKVLSLMTATAMLFMLLPTTQVLADSALGNFTGTQNNSGNWWLNQDIKISTTAELTGSATYKRGIQMDYNTGQVDNKEGSLFVIQNGGTLTISGSVTINGNYAAADAPMFVVENGGKLILKDTATLDYGSMTIGDWAGGGAIYVKSGGVFEMTGGTVKSSYATKGGGVYLEDGATMMMTGGSITGCTATDGGGGIYASSGSTLQMKDGTVSGCWGSGIMTAGTFTVSGTTQIKDNNSSIFGGGLCIFGGTADISTGTKITGNSCSTGGGIAITAGTVTIDGVTISSNTSNTDLGTGAGILMSGNDTSLTVKNSTISSNVSKGDGGGVYIVTSGGSAVFENSEISNNEATANGGGIYMCNGTYENKNTTIKENTAENGGGVAFYNGTFKMESGSITKNSATANYSSGVSIRQRTDKPADIAYFYHSGGSITENNNGGMLVDIDYSYHSSAPSRNIILSGGATMEDNTGTNLYLADDLTVITIADALSGRYYVDAATTAGDVNTVAVAGNDYTISQSDLSCMLSDHDEKQIYLEDNQLKIVNLDYLAPQAAETRVLKSTEVQATIEFTLSYAPTGAYKVYASSDTTSEHSTVTASLSGNTLTLTDIDGDIDEGTYYIRVLKDGGILTNYLALTVASDLLPSSFDISRGGVSVNDGTEDDTIKISYNGKDYDNYSYSTQLAITGESTNTVTVNTTGSDAVNITLSGVSINAEGGYAAVDIQESSNVVVTLSGNNTLQGGPGRAGLQVDQAATLTMKGTGTLTTTGGGQGAGIGGKYCGSSGIINIESGTITAQGGEHAPGIGTGGTYGVGTSISAGAIHISGGTVTASGSNAADGIGHGNSGTVTSITLSGGFITASGGSNSGQALTIVPVLNNRMGLIRGAWDGSQGVYGTKSTTPAAEVATVQKSQITQSAVDFILTTAPSGTYAVYTDSEKSAVHSTVTATLSGTTLTLSDSDGDINPGIFYLAVTENDIAESDTLALTIERQSFQAALDISGSSIKIENGTTAGTIKLTSYTFVYDNIDPAANTFEISGTTTENNIIINTSSNITVNIKLKNVSIDVSAIKNRCAIDIQNNSVVNLSLEGTNTIRSGEFKAGIMVLDKDENTATVIIDGSGALNVYAGTYSAAIGGCFGEGGGNIHIKGGTIVAEGSDVSSGSEASNGIGGGGHNRYAVSIKISGGRVTAKTSDTNAALGAEPVFENDTGYVSGYYTDSTVVIGSTSTAPKAGVTMVAKESLTQASVDFTLITAPAGEYTVYTDKGAGAQEHATVTASLSGLKLTLTDSDGNIDQGTYYIRVTETGKPRSNPLALTVTPYTPSYESAINLENGSITFEDGPSGTIKITQAGTVTDNLDPSLNFTIIGNSTLNTITVNTSSDKTLKLTLQDVTIDVSAVTGSCPLELQNGASVNVTLTGTNSLKSGAGRAGIKVESTDSATASISTGGTGTLTVIGNTNGIGADTQDSGGNVTITGGMVTATGGSSYAALSREPTLLSGVTCVSGSYSGSTAVFAVASEAPAANVSEVRKISEQQDSVSFTLTNAPDGTYQVYVTDSFYSDVHQTVTASLSGTELTLTDSDGDLDVGTYYIRVTQSEKIKSTVLALTILDVLLNSFDITSSSISIEDGSETGTIKISHNGILYDKLNPSGQIKITGNAGGNSREVSVNTSADVTVAIILDGVTIEESSVDESPFSIQGSSNVVLTLVNTNTFRTKEYACAGIEVEQGATVTINGTGTLTATGTDYSAGIGGKNTQTCGTVTIESGTIYATGGSYGAGIGGGGQIDDDKIGGGAGTITINGGKIYAIGGTRGAGIGVGNRGSGGTVTIKGSSIFARGGNNGSGISCSTVKIEGGTIEALGGDNPHGGSGGSGITGNTLTIKGGTVTATSGSGSSGLSGDTITIDDGTVKSTAGNNGSGIGGSMIQINGGTVEVTGGTYCAGINGSTINISGGAVTAQGGNHGAGIGGGNQSGAGTIIIRGGTITTEGGDSGAGIGSGYQGIGGTITISESADITNATGGSYGAGIGGGYMGSVDKITISGGTVNAVGSDSGAAIGGGSNRNSTAIEISGGNVIANGYMYGAGIGGGKNSSGGTILISGDATKVTAKGGSYAAGIGGGQSGSGGTITISGGSVSATGSIHAAGIGGGERGEGGNITINSGVVTTQGGLYGAGIGGGRFSSGGTIQISGGSVTGRSGSDAAGIGSGYQGRGGSITLSGGSVTAWAASTGSSSSLTAMSTAPTLQKNIYLVSGSWNDMRSVVYGEKFPPTIFDISAPSVVEGQKLTLTTPTVSDNGKTVTEQGWQISNNGSAGWGNFDPSAAAMTIADNGKYLRYFATNEDGTTYSNTVQITVTEKQIQSIRIKTPPTKIMYKITQYFDPAGLVITVVYDNGEEVDVPYADNEEQFGFDPSDEKALTLSNTQVTITYREKTVNQAITVLDKEVKSVVLKTASTKTSYIEEEDFDPSGLVITESYDIGEPVDIEYSETTKDAFGFSPSQNLAVSDHTIEITYGGKKITQAITVRKKQLTGITIHTAPLKTVYIEGNGFDPAGLVITASYDNGKQVDIPYVGNETLFVISPLTGLATTHGSVTIAYGGKTVEQAIMVNEKQLERITVKTPPTKIKYRVGQSFHPEGLVITTHYDNGQSIDVPYPGNETSFGFSPVHNLQTENVTVVITYGSKTANQTITVLEKETVSISEAQQTASYDGSSKAFAVRGTTLSGFTVAYRQGETAVTPVNAGTYDVIITRAEDDDNKPFSTTIAGGLLISPLTAALSWTGADTKTYDGSESNVTALVSNLIGSDICLVTVTGGMQKDAGTHTATATALSNGNYALPSNAKQTYSIAKREAILSWAGADERTYDGTASSVTAAVTNLAGSDICSVTVTGGMQKDTGTHTATATALSNDNYALPSNAKQTYSIAKREAILSWAGADTKTYDGTASTVTAAVTNLTGSDICSVTVTGGMQKDAGTHTATATALSNDNYALPSNAEQTYSIAKREAILSWEGADERTYDGTASSVTAAVTNLAGSDICSVTVTGGMQKDAGNYTATATSLSNSNYSLPANTAQSYTINRKAVVVTAAAKEKIVGESDPELTFTQTGVIDGDIIGTLSRGGEETAGKYPIKLSATNPNYLVTYIGSYFTIKSKAAETVTEPAGTITGTLVGATADTSTRLLYQGKTFGEVWGSEFTFNHLADGIYNIEITKGTATKTVDVEVVNGTQTVVPLVIDITTIQKSTKINIVGDDTPNVVVGNMEDAIENGAEFSIVIEKTDADEAIVQKAKSKTIAVNLDITAFVNYQPSTSLNKIIKITIPIPKEVKGKKVAIYRKHNDIIDELAEGFANAVDGEYFVVRRNGLEIVELYVNKFSDYTLAYTKSSSGSGGSGGSGRTLSSITASLKSGEVVVGSEVTLTTSVKDGIIYYTTNGEKPTTKSMVYEKPIAIEKEMVIKAMVNGGNVVTFTYTVRPAKIEFTDNADETRYIAAYSEDTFKPDQAITRYEMIESLSHLLSIETVSTGKVFTDVDEEVADLVNLFAGARIIEGYEDGTFKGGQGMTRAEFVKVMSVILNLDIKDGKSTFSDTNGHWSDRYIAEFAKLGYIKGYEDGSFKPDQKMTRAEFVAIVNRIIQKKGVSVPQVFSDLSAEHWAYADIMAAYLK